MGCFLLHLPSVYLPENKASDNSRNKQDANRRKGQKVGMEILDDNIADDEHRTGIIAKRKQVFALRSGYLTGGDQVAGYFGTHRITAQESCQHTEAAGAGNAEQRPKDGT